MPLEPSPRTTRSGGTKPAASLIKRGHFLLLGSFQPEAIHSSVIKAPEMQLLLLPPSSSWEKEKIKKKDQQGISAGRNLCTGQVQDAFPVVHSEQIDGI